MVKERKRKFLITAGGTREYIDPVRFVSNASSGKMGYALARAALLAGHKVILVTAPTNLKPPKGAVVVKAETASEMFAAVKKYFPECDCLVMAAAVSDYTPVKPSKIKIKKLAQLLTIRFKPTVDILKWAGEHKKRQVVVGFALEDKNIKACAMEKLKKKNLDIIIANSTAAVGADNSSVLTLTADGRCEAVSNAPKSVIAQKVVQKLCEF